jgi:hypothetical protein
MNERGVKEQKEQLMNIPGTVPTLPRASAKKKPSGCTKCERALLMLARVPVHPEGSFAIATGSDEFLLVQSWLAVSLNMQIVVERLSKSGFYQKFIENERVMHKMQLVCVAINEAFELISEGISSPMAVADHTKYVEKELRAEGRSTVLICAFDGGVQAENFCEHTSLPNVDEMRAMNRTYDSLRFRFHGHEAILALDPSRLVPLYAAVVRRI